MAVMNFSETTIGKLYSKSLYDERDFDIGPHQVEAIATVYFNGVSFILKDVKNKEYPVAFVFDGVNMDMYIAAIIRYIPNQDENMPGHWNYIWTFDKADIPENARVIRLTDISFHNYFLTQASEFHFGFRSDAAINELGNYLMKSISQWLQDNAKEDEEVVIRLDGVFEARCIVEDNEVVKSLELIGETKAIVKDDAQIES